MQFKGTAHRYGRDIDTDVIIPARYLTTSDPAELAKHCLEDLDTSFVERVQPGDIIVADENFGITVAMKNNHVGENKLCDIAGKSRLVPDGHGMLEVARRMGISLG